MKYWPKFINWSLYPHSANEKKFAWLQVPNFFRHISKLTRFPYPARGSSYFTGTASSCVPPLGIILTLMRGPKDAQLMMHHRRTKSLLYKKECHSPFLFWFGISLRKVRYCPILFKSFFRLLKAAQI